MSKQTMRQLFNLRQTENKTIRFVTVFVFLVLSSSWQQTASTASQSSRDLKVDQYARVSHAQEILNDKFLLASLKDQKPLPRHVLHQGITLNQIKAILNAEGKKLNADRVAEAIVRVSHKFNFDPLFLLAVIKTESRFNPNAVGSVGEIGLMQIKPSTAEWIAKKKKFPWLGREKLFDPEYNILIGAMYMKYLKRSVNSKPSEYINAYNMGLGSLRRLPAENRIEHPYFERVLRHYLAFYRSFESTYV
jgi:soluble lytic murein transglycosylase